MAMKLYSEGAVQNIADAIRQKNGLTTTYKISEMAQAVLDLPSGGLELVTQEQRTALSIASGSYTTVGQYAFASCTSISQANFPLCTTIWPYAFYQCTSLSQVNFPECVVVNSYAFQSCSSLTAVSFPKCVTIGGAAFAGCTSLTQANFPVCTTIETNAFNRCQSLSEANFPECTSIGIMAFNQCSSLSKLTLGKSNCIIENNTFMRTPMSESTYLGYFGSIYVPSEYLSQYQSATNWSRYSARLVGY